MTEHLDADGRLELDAALGDERAAAQRTANRRETAVGLGIEIG